MVKIRLQRMGAKKHAQYAIVAMDHQKKRDGAYLEKIGLYFPQNKNESERLRIDQDKFKTWLARGAQVSETVGQLYAGLIRASK